LGKRKTNHQNCTLKEINIISFDVPFPPNYGGIIDVFFKIKYFHSKGIKVHLHCFEYGREAQKELEKYCESVHYYKRKTGLVSNLSLLPYIVKSRISGKLKQNLLKNNFPILFEGLHTTYLLDDKDFKARKKIFREHNIEHDYYRHLSNAEKNPIKKLYYLVESIKLKYYEKIVTKADVSLILSMTDLKYFKHSYPHSKFVFVPTFHNADKIKIKPGKGDYVLYHGNLSVLENSVAAKFIINKIFNDLDIPLVIAGLNPGKELKDLVKKHKNITLIANPEDSKLNELIFNAQINFLYTNQATGLKLKLLNVLYNGRFCLVNSKMIEGTTLSDICIVKNDIDDIKDTITKLSGMELSDAEIEKRKNILEEDYSNSNSFKTIIEALKA